LLLINVYFIESKIRTDANPRRKKHEYL